MKRSSCAALLAVLTITVNASAVSAQEWEKYDKPVPTRVVIRVLAHGAKAMSEHTGAAIKIRDTDTNEVLAEGAVEGSTGDDTALMKAGYPRVTGRAGLVAGDKGIVLMDPKGAAGKYYDIRGKEDAEGLKPAVYESKTEAAKFEAVLQLTKPTRIVVDAYGPLLPEHAMASSSGSVWVFPGEDILGEGIVLDLRGLIVDALASLRDKEVVASDIKDGLTVPFYMMMMCGCPVAPAERGLSWEAEKYKITTQAYYKGKLYYEDMTTSDKLFVDTSQFKTKVPLPKDLPQGDFAKERIKIRIMASQPEQGNNGIDEFHVYLDSK